MKTTKSKPVEKVEEVKCNDRHCPFHGNISVRGRIFVGEVKKLSSFRTISVGWSRLMYLPKYERYEKRRTKLMAHCPDCITVKAGDKVKIMETRPISKTKNFVVVEKLK